MMSLLDPTKSPGCDDIIPQHCATSLTEPVTTIFNLSLQTKSYPSQWKIHEICPIPKKGDLKIVNNYRPISLLPKFSKAQNN